MATIAKEFLSRVDNTRFLVDFDGCYVTSTDTPSNAKHLSYAEADGWCQRLRRRGFPQAVVTDIAGNVMTYNQIKAVLQAAAAEKAEDSLPMSHRELDQMSSAEYRRRIRIRLLWRASTNWKRSRVKLQEGSRDDNGFRARLVEEKRERIVLVIRKTRKKPRGRIGPEVK